jgi:hypothetical protein
VRWCASGKDTRLEDCGGAAHEREWFLFTCQPLCFQHSSARGSKKKSKDSKSDKTNQLFYFKQLFNFEIQAVFDVISSLSTPVITDNRYREALTTIKRSHNHFDWISTPLVLLYNKTHQLISNVYIL